MILQFIITFVFLAISHNIALADESLKSTIEDQSAVEVTVYNSNLGLVKDTRNITLSKGKGQLRFMDVAASIIPETVHIKPLSTASPLSVLEQNFEYDLINENKLLDKYVGKKIKILKENPYSGQKETVEATLISNNSGQVYQVGNEIYLGFNGQKILPEIPENLIAKPTLTWLYDAPTDGKQQVEVSYLTNNLNWKADYVLVLDNADQQSALSGWVTLDNKSGATYKNAKLKLIAGQVNRIQPTYNNRSYAMKAAAMEGVSDSAFVEQSFFEYHIYDLQRLTTIKENQTKQVLLLEGSNIKTTKEFTVNGNPNYFYQDYRNGNDYKLPVAVSVSFKNSKENNLGMPLPAGIMRLYKEDGKESLQFIGEDQISHTPKDEIIRLKIGEAFDVVVERKQTDFKIISKNVYETSWEITLRNHKKEDINVSLIETLASFGEWQVLNSSIPYEKQDVSTVKFKASVPKDGETKVTYQIRIRYGY